MKKPAKLLSHSIQVSVAIQRIIIAVTIFAVSIVGTSVRTAVAAESAQPSLSDTVSTLDTIISDTYSKVSLPQGTKQIRVTLCDSPEAQTIFGELFKSGMQFGVIESSLAFISHCDASSLATAYGQPVSFLSLKNESTTETLLVFSAKKQSPINGVEPSSSLLPVSCAHRTIVATVAHEDDDLLFMNPDVQQHIARGGCMVTIYLTAGDFGHEPVHWQNRRIGSETAYATMAHQANVWEPHQLDIRGNKIQASQLLPNKSIVHIYLQLPDGGVTGQGFAKTNFTSLSQFLASRNSTIHSIDGVNNYTKQSLISTLSNIFATVSPSEIWTQDFIDTNHVDHADHVATGELTRRAFYDFNHTTGQYVPSLKLFSGYQLKTLPDNLNPSDVASKKSTFHDYALHDITICDTTGRIPCESYGIYDLYFAKKYSRTFRAQ